MAENNRNGHNPVGRPAIELDTDLIEELAGIGCTVAEIAVICKCSKDTLERNFAAHIEKGRETAKMSLRRRQWQVAMEGSKDKEHANPTLLIWLGKQLLNQRDKQELCGLNGGPIKHEHEHLDLSKLSAEELAELERLVESASAHAGTDTSGTA